MRVCTCVSFAASYVTMRGPRKKFVKIRYAHSNLDLVELKTIFEKGQYIEE